MVQSDNLKLPHRPFRKRGTLWHVPTLLTVSLFASGCGARSVSWNPEPIAAAVPAQGAIAIRQPAFLASAPGNVGRDAATIQAAVANRLLMIVQERFPNAAMAAGYAGPGIRADLYRAAAGESPVSADELDDAAGALQSGATHLLVATISEWKQMRTDDPVGAVLLPHNSVTITLRLMRLQPPTLVGRVTFHNQAGLTLNQPAAGLLDAEFRQATLKLITGH